MIFKWIMDNARYVIAGLALVLIVCALLMMTHCGGNKEVVEQAKQTNRSGQAITAAASDAIETIGDRTVTEQTIDNAVANTTKEIDNAKDADVVRDIVIAGVCSQHSHRNDPACRVR